jgi:SAM-dependent methyltransferase
MLEVAQKEAHARHLNNIQYLEGDAQDIPCEDSSFDVVVCRQAPHHFPRVQQAVREWARVLKPGGKLLLIDSLSPEEPDLDVFLHEIELLRDPSHVRNQRVSEWHTYLEEAGFLLDIVREWGIVLDVADWTKRMRTPAESVAIIEQCLRTAGPVERERFSIKDENGALSFVLPVVFIAGRKIH